MAPSAPGRAAGGRKAAGGHHRRRDAELGTDGRGDAIDLAGETVDRTGLQGLGRVAADGPLRLAHLDLGESGGAARERLHRDLDAGGDRAADIVALGVHDVEVGRRAEVDDDQRRSVGLEAGHCIGDAIGADLGRVPEQDTNAGAHAGPQHERREAQVLLAHRHPLRGEARHDRSNGHLVDRLPQTQPEQREEALQQTGHLVACAVSDRGNAPVAGKDTGVHEADHGLRVADIDHEQHVSPPPC